MTVADYPVAPAKLEQQGRASVPTPLSTPSPGPLGQPPGLAAVVRAGRFSRARPFPALLFLLLLCQEIDVLMA
jgi:hypothetical protein